MLNVQSTLNELRRSIDFLTQDALKKINQGEYEGTNEILLQRFALIKELVALFSQDIDKEALRRYLIELNERDQAIIQHIKKDKAQIKTVLSNLIKMKEYTS